MNYNEFVEKPLIISIDRYPKEWYYYEDEIYVPALDERRQTVEHADTHYHFEYEEELSKGPSLKRQIEELELLEKQPSIELPILEERLVFHLLNYNQGNLFNI